jgi:hypothetical protein
MLLHLTMAMTVSACAQSHCLSVSNCQMLQVLLRTSKQCYQTQSQSPSRDDDAEDAAANQKIASTGDKDVGLAVCVWHQRICKSQD